MSTAIAGLKETIESLLRAEPVAERDYSLEQSQALKERAAKAIPSGAQTFSKAPAQFLQGVAPVYLERAKGSTVVDVDGNSYTDFCMALGAVTLGYADDAVNAAIARQIEDGTVYTLNHPLEVTVSEKLIDLIPSAEMVRFGKNGSDVTSAAVRVARAFTGKEVILCSGYHGWQDWFVTTTTRRAGVPEGVSNWTDTFGYNSLESLETQLAKYAGNVAAIVMEPVGLAEPQEGFLEGVQALGKQHGALLIFDEMVTGFRMGIGGSQQRFGITPDISCFGKGMANGMPVSAVVGRRDVMELFDEIFFSFTFAGETASLAAALATLEALEAPGVLGGMETIGSRIRDGFNLLAEAYGLQEVVQCKGLPPRTGITYGPDVNGQLIRTFFQQECISRGYLFTGAHNIARTHTEADVDSVLHVYRTVLEILKQRLEDGTLESSLKGPVLQPVFRKM